MPEMDGLETLAAIRGNSEAQTDFPGLPEASKIPVIFLTADDDSEIDADTDYQMKEKQAVGYVRTGKKIDIASDHIDQLYFIYDSPASGKCSAGLGDADEL